MKLVMLGIISLVFSAAASSATWHITNIKSGSDGGFGFSSLHDASGSNVMSGAKLVDITGATGTYDDVSGAVNYSFTLSNGDTLGLTGTMLFDGAGWLSSNSYLSYTGLVLPGILSTGVFGYMPGDVCCGGDFDPNSFKGTGVGDLHYMTLWGADGYDGQTYTGSKIGMDFRVELSQVPVPAALLMFAPALLGLFGFRQKMAATA